MNNVVQKLPLAGLKVVEISALESVAYAGMLLGQLGAEVVKIEPPAGDPLRWRASVTSEGRRLGEGNSLAFEFMNAGKTSVVFDSAKAASGAHVQDLIRAADILLVDHVSLHRMALALPERAAKQLRVFVGLYGGREEEAVASSALTRLHAGTSGYIIPADLDTSKRPAWSGPYVFECMHGVGLAVAVVAERAREEGGDVDYSLQSYGLWLDKLLFSRTSTSGVEIHRNTAPYPYGGNMACSDGYVSILVLEEHQWRGFCRMIGRPEWLNDDRFANGVQRNLNRQPLADALEAWCASRSVDEVMAAARRCDVPAGRCRRPGEVLDSDLANARGFFVERVTSFGTLRVPTLPFGPQWRGDVLRASPALES